MTREVIGNWVRAATIVYWNMEVMSKKNLIFRINRIVRSIENSSGLSDLDMSTRSILGFIGEAEAENQTLHVSDVVKILIFGTAPTVYARLRELEKSELTNKVYKQNAGEAQENVKHSQVLLTKLNNLVYREYSKILTQLHENSEFTRLINNKSQ